MSNTWKKICDIASGAWKNLESLIFESLIHPPKRISGLALRFIFRRLSPFNCCLSVVL